MNTLLPIVSFTLDMKIAKVLIKEWNFLQQITVIPPVRKYGKADLL